MARVLRCLSLALALVAAVPDDEIALVQRLVDVPSLSRHATETGLVKPTEDERLQAKGMIDLVTSKGLDKVLFNLNIPDAPQMLKRQLSGALTEWVLNMYSVPKSPAKLDLLNGVIELYGQAFGGPLDNTKVLEELLDWDKLHALVRNYAAESGADLKTLRAIDSSAVAVNGKKGLLTKNEFMRLIRRGAGYFRGHPLADTLFFVTASNPHMDEEALFTHLERLARYYDLPPVVITFLRLEADDVRKEVHFRPKAFTARLWHTFALAADQLLLPLPMSEAFDFVGNLFESKGPVQVGPTISKLYEIAARISIELGGSQALTDLLSHVSDAIGGSAGELPAMAELQSFWKNAIKTGRPDAGEHVRLLARLADQLGLPDAVGPMQRDLAALGAKNTSSMELFKHVAEVLGHIGLPNIGELMKRFAPAAGHFASLLPSLLALGASPELWKARDELKAVRDAIREPAEKMYDNAVAMLSQSKSPLVRKLATAEASRLVRTRTGKQLGQLGQP